jgi:chaperone required for assembly of F1-ATPase
VLDWADAKLSAHFKHANTITHIAQDAASLNAVRNHAENFNAWSLTGVYLLMTLTGSSLLAMMLEAGSTTPDSVWAAAHVDEDYQISQWGEDSEAIARRKARRREFDGLVRYFELLK